VTDVRIRPCADRARAWWGDELVAESTAAVRVDVPGEPPTLWFPWDDVRAGVLRSGGTEPWAGGEVERYDATGRAPDDDEPATWGDRPGGPRDGTGIVRRWTAPPAGLDALAGHACVDAGQARVELDDGSAVTRFPNWGDASDLIAILDRGIVVPDTRRPVVEASQLLGQSIVAAMREAPGRRVVSAHMAFVRAADANQPVGISLDPLANGRTFTAFTATATQGDRRCASGTLLLGVPAADVVTHREAADGVPSPQAAVPYDMGVTGRELRVVDGAYTDDPDAAVGPPSIDAWVRFRDVPGDQAIHAGLLAQFTGHMSIAAALRPHAGVGQREAHRTLSTAINAIAISFHDDVRMDRWVLYRHLATVVHDGMAHSECRVHDEDGALVASFTVDAMIRPLDRPAVDHRTAL
jgi:acyl-CoA thioesterase II